MKNAGLWTHRFKDNPEELRFAEAWDEINETGRILAWLLDTRDDGAVGKPADPSTNDRMVAATVIQWLGSPVGHGFLSELGYAKRAEK